MIFIRFSKSPYKIKGGSYLKRQLGRVGGDEFVDEFVIVNLCCGIVDVYKLVALMLQLTLLD